MDTPDDFFVPDEPADQVLAAFHAGIKGKTKRPHSAPRDAADRRRTVDNPFGRLSITWGVSVSAARSGKRFGTDYAAPRGAQSATTVGA